MLLSPPGADEAVSAISSSFDVLETIFRRAGSANRNNASASSSSSSFGGGANLGRSSLTYPTSRHDPSETTPYCPEIGPDGSWLYPIGLRDSRDVGDRLSRQPWTRPSAPGELVGLEWGPGGETLVVGAEWCLMKWQMCVFSPVFLFS
jgi:hypothetical protein